MDKKGLGGVAITHTLPSQSETAKSIKHTRLASEDEGHEDAAKKSQRIHQELADAGMTWYGFIKFNTRYLPKIIQDYEHLKGVIYGRHIEGPGFFLNWVDRMILATDRRVISLNHKPGYTDLDEFTYDTISEVDVSTAGPFTAVTLNVRESRYSIRFVNRRCAEIFRYYIEHRRLEYFKFFSLKNRLSDSAK